MYDINQVIHLLQVVSIYIYVYLFIFIVVVSQDVFQLALCDVVRCSDVEHAHSHSLETT